MDSKGLHGLDQTGAVVRIEAAWIIAIHGEPSWGITYVKLLDGRLITVAENFQTVLEAIKSEPMTLH